MVLDGISIHTDNNFSHQIHINNNNNYNYKILLSQKNYYLNPRTGFYGQTTDLRLSVETARTALRCRHL